MWRFISNEPNEDESQIEATEIHNDKIQNKKRIVNKYSTKRYLQRKRQKKVDYRKYAFDDIRLMIVYPPSKQDSDESDFFSSCYVPSMENQPNEVFSNMVLTHLFKRWVERKTQLNPSSIAYFFLPLSLKIPLG